MAENETSGIGGDSEVAGTREHSASTSERSGSSKALLHSELTQNCKFHLKASSQYDGSPSFRFVSSATIPG